MTTRILGTGSYLPEERISNDRLAEIVDTSDEWISTRTGIRNRRIVTRESGAGMAAEAAKKALENAQVNPEEISLIIVATCTADQQFPSTACVVQKEIGAVHAAAFDLGAACSGFLFALNTAHAYIQAGFCEKALVIGTEVLSKLIDWTDRSTCVLFGDGAGAVVVGKDDTGMEGFVQHADGSMGDVLTCMSRPVTNFLGDYQTDYRCGATEYLSMNGQEVFKFAVKKVPQCIQQVLTDTDTKAEDVDWYILHQANSRIIQSVAKRLQVSVDRFPMNMDQYGNTSAASIPILLDEMNREGNLIRGQQIVLSGFGAGLTWGAAKLRW